MPLRMTAIRAVLDTLYFTGMHRLSEPFSGGLGAILMFHRVRPQRATPFQPNAFLEITPAFLGEVIAHVKDRDIEIVSMTEACRRIRDNDTDGRFVALTFDDGYRDNAEHALPILEREAAPFTVFVASDFAEGRGSLWWSALEDVIATNDQVTTIVDGEEMTLDCATPEAKDAAYQAVVRTMQTSASGARDLIPALADRYDYDFAGACRAACMSWAELASLDQSPLCTIGAHTITHPSLARLERDEALHEMGEGARRISENMGIAVTHFAYPHGGPADAGQREFALATDLGFGSAVTTRPGVVHGDHANHMTALPRISVNGLFQQQRYVDVLLSGAPTMLKNRLRRVNAA